MTTNGMKPGPEQSTEERTTPLPGARAALILLLAINLFNYIDRQVLAAVLPKLEDAFLADDPDPKFKLGLLPMAFMVSYMVLAPLFGWLGDRTSRWLLVAIGVILWSLASGASGLAATFMLLLITRCFVGVGEAAYGPVAPTLISDLYPVKIRGSVLAWFYAAIPVGSALGYVLGGVVGDSLGWSWAFYLVVPPGLLLGVCCFLMREPPRGQADAGPIRTTRRVGLKEYLTLARIPSYVLNTLGMAAMTFAIGGIGAWMPTYILEREGQVQLTESALQALGEGPRAVPESVLRQLQTVGDRVYPYKEFKVQLKELLPEEDRQKYQERILDVACHPTLGSINTIFGAIVVISGLAATLLGGMAGDWLRRWLPGSYFLISGSSMLVAFPLFLLVLSLPFPTAWVFVFLTVFFLFFNTGPTNTILANVTHPAIRSTAFAVNIFIIHVLGDASSPSIMGRIADKSSMNVAMLTASVIVLVGGVLWLWGARYLQRDTELATTRLPDVELSE
jgi:MFS family permease